jgi:hypothetical protein
MTLQEQLRDAEIEVARLEKYSTFLKDRARRIREYLILQPTGIRTNRFLTAVGRRAS